MIKFGVYSLSILLAVGCTKSNSSNPAAPTTVAVSASTVSLEDPIVANSAACTSAGASYYYPISACQSANSTKASSCAAVAVVIPTQGVNKTWICYQVPGTSITNNGNNQQLVTDQVRIPSATPYPTLTLYRQYENDDSPQHFLTTNSTVASNSFTSDGAIVQTFSSKFDSTMVALYNCIHAVPANPSLNLYFTSTSSACEGIAGYTASPIGYGHAMAHGSEVPLYRYYNSVTGDHVSTTTQSGRFDSVLLDGRYHLDGITAYVLPMGASLTP